MDLPAAGPRHASCSIEGMVRLSAFALALVLGLSPVAGATPISTVASAAGEADVSNQTDRAAWMPQLAANLVFREAIPGIAARSLEALARLAARPLSIQATTLDPGNPQLVFSDSKKYYVSTRASFIASIP